jgi:DNA/RNA-binding domain of Phe-tRNA-synthetase-like protein
MFRIQVDPQILQSFPQYSLMVIYAKGLQNFQSQAWSTEILRQTESAQRPVFATQKPAEHEHIAAWRSAYGAFGLKPSKFLCSAEALLSRVVKGQDLPSINTLVDLYNAISIKHVMPIGGEDWDRLEDDLVLRFADGSEGFDTFKDGQPILENPQQGEVIWADGNRITCRAWNWRQGIRTRLTEQSVNAYFILDHLAPYPLEHLHTAGNELMALLKQLAPSCEIETELFGAVKPNLSGAVKPDSSGVKTS